MLNHLLKNRTPFSYIIASIALLLMSTVAQAAPANTAPKSLTERLNQLETAANNGNLEAVRSVYSQNFSAESGLNVETLTQKLEQLWDTYSRLDYQVELQSWEREGDAIIAETVTRIRGLREIQGEEAFLDARLRSRQRFRNGKIVSQNTLEESSRLYIGSAPRVKVNAPNEVEVGEEFNFDVIVREPVGNDILLGTALEEAVTSSKYLAPQELDLEILPAGGIYRLGKIDRPGERWLSAIIVRDDGMTLISERVNVISPMSALSNSKPTD